MVCHKIGADMKNINAAPLFQNEGKTFIPHKTLKILYEVGFVKVSQSVQHTYIEVVFLVVCVILLFCTFRIPYRVYKFDFSTATRNKVNM